LSRGKTRPACASTRGSADPAIAVIRKSVPYHLNQVPNSARWQIFLRDPNNIEIELNFESKNETGA
jgi:hypothetical protein